MIVEVIYLSTELDLLDLRLHELNEVVDKFIIVEYPTNFAGAPCKMYYNENKERFKQFEDKIIHVIDNTNYNYLGLGLVSLRQNSPSLLNVLSFCKDTDFLVVCDGDAIIKKETFNNLDLTKHITFRMEWCLYWMNAYCPDVGFDWAFGAPMSFFRRAGGLSHVAHNVMHDEVKLVSNSGWHWSKLGGVEKIIENIKGYPHQNYARDPRLLDPILIQQRIDKMQGWDDGSSKGNPNGWKYKIRKFDPNYYPKYINERWDIFSKYFKEV
jgi:hypothetical protein